MDGLTLDTRARLESEWALLCERHLPVASGDFWRSSRRPEPDDLPQGWKLHVSATVLAACDTLTRIAPLLTTDRVLFKAPGSLDGVNALNCGLFFGFSQVGKVITVYPRSAHQAMTLAEALHRLTVGLPAPPVPYDRQYAPGSNVHYRYGAFTPIVDPISGAPAFLAPTGERVADVRDRPATAPAWARDPFPSPVPAAHDSGRLEQIRAFESLSQRGKGGVYRALELDVRPVRVCILKEGRASGEQEWDGRDGCWRVRHEADVLRALAANAVPVPIVYESFEAGQNSYISMEELQGEPLIRWLQRGRRAPWPVRLRNTLEIGAQLAALLHQIHAAGWLWRDCKPANLIVAGGLLRPLDFEGACPIDDPDVTPWGTPGYSSLRSQRSAGAASIDDDRYSFSATLAHLLAERPPTIGPPPNFDRLRRFIPEEIKTLVRRLASPGEGPALLLAAEQLRSAAAGIPMPRLATRQAD